MSQLKLTADGGGGTVSLKGPSSTTGNAAIELTVPGTGNATLLTSATSTGKILQVKSVSKLDSFSLSSPTVGQYYDVTGLDNLQITTTGSNKVIVFMSLYMGISYNGYNAFMKGIRTTSGSVTNLSYPSTTGGSYRASGGHWTNNTNVPSYLTHPTYIVGFEDSPGAGTHQYGIQIGSSYNATIYTGRPYGGESTGYVHTPSGTITLMEVAA